MDGGKHIVLHQALGQNDGVLVVVTLPGHEGNQQVAAQGQLAAISCRSISNYRTKLNPVTVVNQHALVVAGALVGALELSNAVVGVAAVVI